MDTRGQWLRNLSANGESAVDGLVYLAGYNKQGQPPEEVAVMEKAEEYKATAVFFEAGRDGKPPIAQAFVYVSDGPVEESKFAKLHKRLWSWGGVPLVYLKTLAQIRLFRCAHKPDFEYKGEIDFRPHKTLDLAAKITQSINKPWWDAELLRSGALWDDPETCKEFLSDRYSAQKDLINEVKRLHDNLTETGILSPPLRRKLLILSLLIAYLENRKVFEAGFFAQFRPQATEFFEVLADGPALVDLLDHLEQRFNGHVFALSENERAILRGSQELAKFADLVEGKQEASGQRTIWQRYSFADLPVELISHIYQLFVDDKSVAVYTPHFLVRLIVEETLSWERLNRIIEKEEIILDPACGSGVFLVEAYKRLVLHWRSKNGWQRPNKDVLQALLKHVHGIDLEVGAVELAAFSLCLALCDALKPEEIRASVRLFPDLRGSTIHRSCFFEALENEIVEGQVGAVVGNPPFASSLNTDGAQRAYDQYQDKVGLLPDKQLAYLFLHKSMEILAEGGILGMLQQYNFLYNQLSLDFRRKFIERWNVREILDFISVRGLFQKGSADTKIVVIVAEATNPAPDTQLLHATFRRTGRTDAEQGFDIDYYDLHWLPRQLALINDGVWRSNLLGGGRVLGFVDRLKEFRTLGDYAEEQGWDYGEGFIEGASNVSRPAEHIIGHPLLPSEAITLSGIDASAIVIAPDKLIEGPRSAKRFTPPMLLIREQMDLPCGFWSKGYLTYKNKVVGICGNQHEAVLVSAMENWIQQEHPALQAFVAAISVRLFTQRATTLSAIDILSLPYPENRNLGLSTHEQILVDDIVDYYRDLIRLGEDSAAMKETGIEALPAFNETFTQPINAIYKNKLRPIEAQIWPGAICQPFVFGDGEVDWSGADKLQDRIDGLLHEQRGSGLNITRIARIYDGQFIYLLKPDRLRYWLRSVALRDADETLADLWEQGF